MEDITNYPDSNQLSFTKEPSFQKMEEENDPSDITRRANPAFQEPARENATQSRNQALLQLLKSYAGFISESSDVILDMDVVLNRLVETTRSLKPPQK